MVFNKKISGFDNEFEFAKILSNKKISQLNPMFESFIFDLYGKISEDKKIECSVDFSKQKTDIIIIIDGIKKRISIKKGVKNSVHVEPISTFIEFLKTLKIEKNLIDIYLRYHFADGTNDGTGKKRMCVADYKKDHQNDIDRLNLSLNQIDVIKEAISRFIITGRNSSESIDAIIYGVTDDFIWILKKDIIRIVLSKRNEYSSAIHFGPLIVQPQNRCLNGNKRYEKERYCVQIKWYNISDDIIENINENSLAK